MKNNSILSDYEMVIDYVDHAYLISKIDGMIYILDRGGLPHQITKSHENNYFYADFGDLFCIANYDELGISEVLNVSMLRSNFDIEDNEL